MEMKTEMIVLNVVPYREHNAIITGLSKDMGFLKLFLSRGSMISPMIKAEVTFLPKPSGLPNCQNVAPINHYKPLRQDFQALSAAGRMLRILLDTQLEGKPTPELYLLLDRYLDHLHCAPDTLEASFLLKFLRHEGLLPSHVEDASEEDMTHLTFLATARSLSSLLEYKIAPSLLEKVRTIFQLATEVI